MGRAAGGLVHLIARTIDLISIRVSSVNALIWIYGLYFQKCTQERTMHAFKVLGAAVAFVVLSVSVSNSEPAASDAGAEVVFRQVLEVSISHRDCADLAVNGRTKQSASKRTCTRTEADAICKDQGLLLHGSSVSTPRRGTGVPKTEQTVHVNYYPDRASLFCMAEWTRPDFIQRTQD